MITNLYIDGLNLYHRALKDTPYRWRDLQHGMARGFGFEDRQRCGVRRQLSGASRADRWGDVARWPNQYFGEVMRVEHRDSVVTQGAHSARYLLVGVLGFNRPHRLLRYRILIGPAPPSNSPLSSSSVAFSGIGARREVVECGGTNEERTLRVLWFGDTTALRRYEDCLQWRRTMVRGSGQRCRYALTGV